MNLHQLPNTDFTPKHMLPRALLLTALQCEYDAVRRQLRDITRANGPSDEPYRMGILDSNLEETGVPEWEVIIARTGDGNVNAAILTEKLIQHFRPHALLFVGVAGALKADLNLFDVVVATEVTYYEKGKLAQQFISRHEKTSPTWKLVKQAEYESREVRWTKRLINLGINDVPAVKLLPIAAGEKVITNPKSTVVKHIRRASDKAAAVEMEGFGFLQSIYTNNAQGLIVRSISDRLADKNSDQFGGDEYRQTRASLCAGAFAMEVLANLRVADPEPIDPADNIKFTIQVGSELSEINVGQAVREIRIFTADGSVITLNIRRGSAFLECEGSRDAVEILVAAHRAGVLRYILGHNVKDFDYPRSSAIIAPCESPNS